MAKNSTNKATSRAGQSQLSLPSATPDERKLPSGGHLMLPMGHPATVAPTKVSSAKRSKLTKEEVRDIIENRKYAVVSYLYVLCLVSIFARRQSKFVRFHASQGIVILALSIIFMYTPAFINIPVQFLLFLGIIIGMFEASNGFYYKLPIIYDLVIGKLPESEIPELYISLTELWETLKKSISASRPK